MWVGQTRCAEKILVQFGAVWRSLMQFDAV
jgi:hypothetical protein